MSTLVNRPNTALLVVDVQTGVVEGNHERDAGVANVAALVERARNARVHVVGVQHNSELLPRGSEPWQLVAELEPREAEQDATLLSDAHTTEDQSPWGAPSPDLVIAHTNLYWSNHRAPGRAARTVTTDEVNFGG